MEEKDMMTKRRFQCFQFSSEADTKKVELQVVRHHIYTYQRGCGCNFCRPDSIRSGSDYLQYLGSRQKDGPTYFSNDSKNHSSDDMWLQKEVLCRLCEKRDRKTQQCHASTLDRLSDRLRVKRVEVSLSTKGDSPSPLVDLGGDVSTGDLLSATSLSLSHSLSVVLSGSLSRWFSVSLSRWFSVSLSLGGSPRGNGALPRWLFSETSPSVSLIGDVSLCRYLSLSLWFSLSLLVVLLESLLELFGSVSRWVISSKLSIGGSPQIERYKDQAEDRLKVPRFIEDRSTLHK
ncbi:hypothetical protein YC2023_115243 [Brassica napus]